MAENFLNLVKDINLQNQEVSKCQIGETKENQAHTIIMKLLKMKEKKNFESSQRKTTHGI